MTMHWFPKAISEPPPAPPAPPAAIHLTDEERESLSMAYSRLTADSKYDKVTKTLRSLLERLK
jgi:hypothetical protein